ncbi:MAG: TaqI-like C-terminal specificity domain-containing protein [Chloroflexota bacterium]
MRRYYTLNTLYNLISSDEEHSLMYFLAIINSRLGAWLWRKTNSDFKTIFPKIKKSQIESILIYPINFDDSADKDRHDGMVKLVEDMLRLKQEYAAAEASLSDKRHELAEQIERTDKAINALVYELYGLTEDEIRIVEG